MRVQHTLGDREKQSVVQTVAQDVSQKRQTPAAGAGAQRNLTQTIGTVDVTHGDWKSGSERERERCCARTS